MAFSTTPTSGLSSDINVTPLIDVLLVMLIIFMVIVPVMPHGLDSVLASPGAGESAARPVLVEVEQVQPGIRGTQQPIPLGDYSQNSDDNIRYVVDGAELRRDEVGPRLLTLLSARSLRQVVLRADPKLDFGVVAGVIEAGKVAGAESVGLLTPGSDSQSNEGSSGANSNRMVRP